MTFQTTSSAISLVALLAVVSTGALAGPLDLKAPEIEISETQSAIERALKSGFPANTDPAALPLEVNKGYAITDTFKAGIKANFDSPLGEDMRLKGAGFETKLSLGQIGPSISWGWFTGLDMKVQPGETNAVASGPLLKLGSDKLALTLNPKVEHNFGSADDGGVAFAYAAGLKSEISKGVALGIEAYGPLSEAHVAPDAAALGHHTSPSLYVGLGLTPPKANPDGSKFSLEVGALAGMSEAAPDLTGRVKAAITW